MKSCDYKIYKQDDAYASPWSKRTRFLVLLWDFVWLFFYRPTPKYLYKWRIFLLKIFGAKVTGDPYVAPSSIIKMPWNLTIENKACLGPKSEVYNLGHVHLKARCTVSQEAYICAGSHDFSLKNLPLITASIEIGEDSFLGARAFILPGVKIGDGALIGAASVVTTDVQSWTIVAGNPAKAINKRRVNDEV